MMLQKTQRFICSITTLLLIFSFGFFEGSIVHAWDEAALDSPFGFTTSFYPPKRKSNEEMLAKRKNFEFDGITGDNPPYSTAIELGVKWERQSNPVLDWSFVQRDKESIQQGKYNWTIPDNFLKRIPEEMNIVVTINVNTKLLRPGTWEFIVPQAKEAYIEFVKKAVERYDGDGKDDMPGLKNPVKYWQVENEPVIQVKKKQGGGPGAGGQGAGAGRQGGPPPGMGQRGGPQGPGFMGGQRGQPPGSDRMGGQTQKGSEWKGYVELINITSSAIKSADKNAKVLSGGIVSPPPKMRTEILNEFWLPVIRALDKDSIDIFDFHWFDDSIIDSYTTYKILRNALDESGLTNVDVWMTETGASSKEGEKGQAIQVIKRYVYPLSYGIKKVFWAWALVEGWPPFDCESMFEYTGLIYDGNCAGDPGYGVKKLGFYTYRLMTEKLKNSDWNNVAAISNGKNGIYAYKFPQAEKDVYVLWYEKENGKTTIDLKVAENSKYTVTEAIPNVSEGKQLHSASKNIFNTKTLISSGKTLPVEISSTPVFVEGKKSGDTEYVSDEIDDDDESSVSEIVDSKEQPPTGKTPQMPGGYGQSPTGGRPMQPKGPAMGGQPGNGPHRGQPIPGGQMPPQRGQSSDNLPTTISGKSYRDLEVWQSSMDLAVECYNLTKEIPQGKNDALAGQLQRTAASIPATIAKGQAMQNPKEFFNHLSIANGSIAELETYLQVAERLDYIDSDSIKQIKQKAETIAASISRLQKPFADKTQH
ncbi:hypothetical protein KsCSTR_38890 [Candidatus Kuenenia stuttgartiensis]|jgi:four helix bundle protein|uniref:Asl1-like glycosyl hydrolase catalytic domain-containing protein n=2 Tax=Kuenenia stuttgartiensis TaxID=174633 RepID=Q1PUP1_KUEST|nr:MULTISPECIES: four helix bundle protein [Kuenenia]MBZ0190978.1 four helix bundle protein [Candidatus Kuenenia stuttgartiensis]MCL4726494.1 four helix bundle protein [Candidatus Kuenenia stuttgartiensis]MCZ7621116.1 four helix bundle protein [Candidatus Kuenenia sp.]QII13268.1 hypothetical protein KsCSTR_38890 [Candidatus Kuenenia stuttgartiensis]CAJ70953.1 unknown protein [Candidatus Kuenenia stuttgartiensis]